MVSLRGLQVAELGDLEAEAEAEDREAQERLLLALEVDPNERAEGEIETIVEWSRTVTFFEEHLNAKNQGSTTSSSARPGAYYTGSVTPAHRLI